MTGFARTEGVCGPVSWIWEARSVNGRGLDVKLRTPSGLDALETVARERANALFKRGSLQVTLTLARETAAAQLKIDHAFVQRVLEEGRAYEERGLAAPPRWDGVLALRGALVSEDASDSEDDREALVAALSAGVVAVLERLRDARRTEGRALQSILSNLLDDIERLTRLARETAGDAPAIIAERLRQRIAAVAPEIAIDPARFAQEAAIIASRGDVTEEIERLLAHAAEARALIARDEAAGRRLDFLAQEFAREANTLCAKAADIALTRIGLDLKTAVDQLKEQSANVE